MVTCETAPKALGITEAGANAQVIPAGRPTQERAVEVLKPLSPVMVTGKPNGLDCPGGGCGIVIALPGTGIPFAPKKTVKSFTLVVVVPELFVGLESGSSAEAVNVMSCEATRPGVTLRVNGALLPAVSVPALQTTVVVPAQFGPLPAATKVYPAGTLYVMLVLCERSGPLF